METQKYGTALRTDQPLIRTDEHRLQTRRNDRKVLKTAYTVLEKAHKAQSVNCLKATGTEAGLLTDFGREIEIKRRILDQ